MLDFGITQLSSPSPARYAVTPTRLPLALALALAVLAAAFAGCAGNSTQNADGSSAESNSQDTKAALVDIGADIGCGIASVINKDCAKGARVGARVADKVVSWVFRSLKIADGNTVNKEYEDKKLKVAKDDVKPMAFTSEIKHADAVDPKASRTAAEQTQIKVTSNTDLVGYGDKVPAVSQRYALYDENNKLVSTQTEKLAAVDGAGRYETEATIKVPKAKGKKKYRVETTLVVDGKDYKKNSYNLTRFDDGEQQPAIAAIGAPGTGQGSLAGTARG